MKRRSIQTSLLMMGLWGGTALAAPLPSINISPGGSSPSDTISILALLTLISFVPAILLTMTAFIRIITVLSFVRSALGLQDTPPNQVLIGGGCSSRCSSCRPRSP